MSQELAEKGIVTPIALAQSFLDGKGLTKGDPAEFDGEGIEQETPAQYALHNFHTGKIMVSIYESEASSVRIEGSKYDEFVQILEGRLILTPDGGEATEFKTGDSLVVPKGYVGSWEMPEKYRELIIIDTAYLEEGDNDA